MGKARDELAAQAAHARLRDYIPEADEPHPFDEPPVKTPCEVCTVPAIGRLCKDHQSSGPDDRRVRRSN